MKKLRLDSILLFALTIPFIMNYRIGPGETPYWLFGFIFLSLLLYGILDIVRLSEKLYSRLKQISLWVIIFTVIGSAFSAAIIVRHNTAPTYMVHDIILQQESAIRFLLDGKNPYATTYFGTPLEQWHYSTTDVNPALYHFVMQPFYLLFALPFYAISIGLFGFFDARFPLLFLFAFILFIGAKVVKQQEQKRLFLILLAFNPATLPHLIEGRSDVFMFAFLFFGLFLLYKKRYMLSGIPIALAFATKQSAWPLFPFYIAFLYFKTKSLSKTAKSLMPFSATFIAIVLPFFLWDKKAFLDSTVFYLSGSAPHSYPISGYGIGRILNELGFITDLKQYYPFHLWQLVIGIPLFVVLLRYLQRGAYVSRLILVYGIFLFVFWYLSRYFNNSHLGYLSMIFITAYFWLDEGPKDEK